MLLTQKSLGDEGQKASSDVPTNTKGNNFGLDPGSDQLRCATLGNSLLALLIFSLHLFFSLSLSLLV